VSAGKDSATDVISVSTITDKGYDGDLDDGDFNTPSGWTFASSATYASGNFFFDSGEGYVGLDEGGVFASTASAGKVKSISIVWVNDDELNNDGEAAELTIFARNSTPYTGSETYTTIVGDECHTFTYKDGVTTYNFSSEYDYVALAVSAGAYGAYVSSISIEWEWEVITYYTISEGKITDGDWGDNVTVSTTSAKEGDEVTITFTPKFTGKKPKIKKYSLTSYGFDGMTFDLSCTTYPTYPSSQDVKFLMPARNVTIDAVFEIVDFTDALLKIDKSVTEVQSGVDATISFTHLDKTEKPITDYAISYFSATSDDESVVKAGDFVKVSDGNYTFNVRGLAVGSATISIDGASKGVISSSHDEITITVTPREVVLVAEKSGNHYIMKNTITSFTADATEVTYCAADGRYYYTTGDLTVSQYTWNIAEPDENEYTIQNPNNENKFLQVSKENFKEDAASYSWYKDYTVDPSGLFKRSGATIVCNGTKFSAGETLDGAAKEALIGRDFIPFGSYSTVSGATINDTRSLTEGGYGTFCSPYDVPDVSTAGAKFYTLTGKVLDGDRLAGVVISEDPVTALEAGHSYLYQVDKGSSAINLEGCMNLTTEAWTGKDGFVGCLTGDGGGTGKISVPDGRPRATGCYVMSSGQLRYVGAGATASARAYRAYFDVSELDEVEPASVPRRCFLRWEEFKGQVGYEDTPTGINEVEEVSVINWNEPVYNIMGIRVGKGATGVLIQNGRKFFVK